MLNHNHASLLTPRSDADLSIWHASRAREGGEFRFENLAARADVHAQEPQSPAGGTACLSSGMHVRPRRRQL